MSASISRRLVFWLAIPLMLLSLCQALVHYLNDVAPGVISIDQRLRGASNALMARLKSEQGHLVLDTRSDAGPALPTADSVRYVIRDAAGGVLAGDPRLPVTAFSPGTAQQFFLAELDRRIVRLLATRVDTRTGVLTITVADVGRAAAHARYGLMSTLLWDFVQLDVTLVLVWLGIQLGLRPIKRLRDDIAERSPLDLRPILESSVPRELTPVVVTLNRLFGLLRTTAQSQQQFIANTAHQLRTPITGIQTQLDLLAAEADSAALRGRLATLQVSIRTLAHAANQLLTLARADPSANVASKLQNIDLKDIVGEVAAKFFDRAIKAEIDFGIEAVSVQVHADPALLDDLLSNLVDNALKYTPAGGRVTASSGLESGRVFLAVQDSGAGIPEEHRMRVRQRFYRLPNSPGHGSGLGLAIVDEIARLYGATLSIANGSGGRGTRVTVLFPLRE